MPLKQTNREFVFELPLVSVVYFFQALCIMLEQQLINAFMKLTAKAGAGHLVRELIHAVDENGNPKAWNVHEMEEAIAFINMQVERFDKDDAAQVMRSLMKKFQLSLDDIPFASGPLDFDEDAHVRGLQ